MRRGQTNERYILREPRRTKSTSRSVKFRELNFPRNRMPNSRRTNDAEGGSTQRAPCKHTHTTAINTIHRVVRSSARLVTGRGARLSKHGGRMSLMEIGCRGWQRNRATLDRETSSLPLFARSVRARVPPPPPRKNVSSPFRRGTREGRGGTRIARRVLECNLCALFIKERSRPVAKLSRAVKRLAHARSFAFIVPRLPFLPHPPQQRSHRK